MNTEDAQDTRTVANLLAPDLPLVMEARRGKLLWISSRHDESELDAVRRLRDRLNQTTAEHGTTYRIVRILAEVVE